LFVEFLNVNSNSSFTSGSTSDYRYSQLQTYQIAKLQNYKITNHPITKFLNYPIFLQAVSSLSNTAPIFSIGFTLSSLSISSSIGGVWGAARSKATASFQLMEPSPGHKWVSRSLALS